MDETVLSLACLAFNELEAFVELMFLAAHADGTVAPEELAAFRGQVIARTAGTLDAVMIDAMLAQVEKQALANDPETRLAKIRDRLRDPRKRHAALVHAARVVLADSVLALDEVAFLGRALAVLGEPADRVSTLLAEAREEVV